MTNRKMFTIISILIVLFNLQPKAEKNTAAIENNKTNQKNIQKNSDKDQNAIGIILGFDARGLSYRRKLDSRNFLQFTTFTLGNTNKYIRYHINFMYHNIISKKEFFTLSLAPSFGFEHKYTTKTSRYSSFKTVHFAPLICVETKKFLSLTGALYTGFRGLYRVNKNKEDVYGFHPTLDALDAAIFYYF